MGWISVKFVWLRISISVVASGLIIARLIWPDVKIDSITLGLAVIAVLPWLTSLIESAKFPGGWEIKFRDLQEAGQRVSSGRQSRSEPRDLSAVLTVVSQQDPNLALVALRIEIEKRVRRLAELNEVHSKQPLARLMRELHKRESLPQAVFGGLQEIVNAGNHAAHGARVEPAVSDWALTSGPEILAVLDDLLEAQEGGREVTV